MVHIQCHEGVSSVCTSDPVRFYLVFEFGGVTYELDDTHASRVVVGWSKEYLCLAVQDCSVEYISRLNHVILLVRHLHLKAAVAS